MAALTRATKANYVIHDHIEAETSDREDHTFCGIMFPVKCKSILPIDHVVINSVSVRGGLGPLTVWVTKEDCPNNEISMSKKHWTKIYSKTHAPSYMEYKELDLSANPIRLMPGQVKGIYIHSTRRGDEAIVYDNKEKRKTHDDSFITIMPGRAHLSETVFGSRPIWGWGHAWRDNREFVGQIKYGAVYTLWNPTSHLSFGSHFRHAARVLFQCQRRTESPFSKLPDDCIFYILNMCRWDWVNDTCVEMRRMERERRRRRLADMEAEADGMLEDEDTVGISNERVVANNSGDGGNLVDTEDEDNDYMEEDDSSDEEVDEDSDSEEEQYTWGDHVSARDAFVYHDEESDDTEDDEEGREDEGHDPHREVLMAEIEDRSPRRRSMLRARASIYAMLTRAR